jgi:hypothetical protein
VEAHLQPRYGCHVEDGGAFRRKDEPAEGQSEWLPEDEPDREENGPDPEAAGKPVEAERPATKAKADGKQKPTAKAKSEAKAKPQTEPKPEAKAKETAKARTPAKSKPADRRRQREEQARAPSDVDALGQDKHRQVIGQHNPNRGKQFLYYAAFLVFVVLAYIGLSAAVSHFDKAPSHDPAKAPWAQKGAPQIPLGGFEPKQKDQKGPTHFQ